MSARRIVATAAVALGLAGAVASCGGRTSGHAAAPAAKAEPVRTAGCATHTVPPTTDPETQQPANESALTAVADRIEPRAQERYPEVYAGLEIVPEQDRLRVYRKPSAELDAWVLRDFRAECVELVDAPHSAVELSALQSRIENDFDYWDQHGVHIETVVSRQDGTAVEVGTADVNKARIELPKRYGTAIQIVVNSEGPQRPGAGTGKP